jgi:uncharacterized damage-inducible protein DinB
MANPIREQILATLDFTQTQLQNIFAAIPDEHFLHQPFPGANHALWTMGHLATVDRFFLKTFADADPALFERHKAAFFAKSSPSPNAADYPSINEVRAYFQESRKAFRDWIESLDEGRLTAPLSPELQKRFAPTLASVLSRLAWHEGMHYGQLTVLRKGLGLSPIRI